MQEIKDPQTISWVEPSNVLRNTVQYLTRTDANNITHPELLDKWEASEDLKTWTLTIRQAAKWRSGRPFTSDDAIWNIKRVLDPKTGSSVLGLMKGYMLESYNTGEIKDGKPVTSVRLWSDKAIEKIDDKTFPSELQATAARGSRAPVPLSILHARSRRKCRRQAGNERALAPLNWRPTTSGRVPC